MTVSGFGFAACLLALGLSPDVPRRRRIVLAFTGGMSLLFQSMCRLLLLDLSDFDYHGRIQSLVMLGFSGFGIAALPLGALADAIGLGPRLSSWARPWRTIMVLFVSATRRVRARELVLDLG